MADAVNTLLTNLDAVDNTTPILEIAEKALDDYSEAVETATASLAKNASFTQQWEAALDSATSAADAAAITADLLVTQLLTTGRAYEESSQKVIDAQKKLSEFGATAETQARAMALIADATDRYGVSASKAAIVMEELAIEFGDGEAAVKAYDEVMKFAAASTDKTEVAVASMTDAMKGGTDGLRRFGAEARAIAVAIDKISDPALRAKKATEELARAQRIAAKGGTLQTKITDKLALAQLELAKSGPIASNAIMAIGAAYAAAGAAVAAFVASSIRSYLKTNKEAVEQTDALKASIKDLQNELGGAIVGYEEVGDKIGSFTVLINEATLTVKNNKESISDLVNTGVEMFGTLSRVLIRTTQAAITPMVVAWDALKVVFGAFGRVASAVWGNAIELILEGLSSMGIVSDETAASFAAWRAEANETLEELVTNAGESTVGMFEAADAADTLAKRMQDAATGTGALSKELIDLKKEQELLKEFVGPLQENAGAPKKKKRGRGKKVDKRAESEAANLEMANAIIETELKRVGESLTNLDELRRRRGVQIAAQAEQTAESYAEAMAVIDAYYAKVEDTKAVEAAADAQRDLQSAAEFAADTLKIQAGAMEDVIGGAIGLADSLASGKLALKDLGSAALEMVGDVAIKMGQAMLFMGLGLEGLATLNPVALITFGGLAIAAGIGMKKAAAHFSSSGPSVAASGGGGQLERIGQKLIEMSERDQKESGAVNVFVGGRAVRDFAVDSVSDAMSRGQMMPTPLLGQTSLLGAG